MPLTSDEFVVNSLGLPRWTDLSFGVVHDTAEVMSVLVERVTGI